MSSLPQTVLWLPSRVGRCGAGPRLEAGEGFGPNRSSRKGHLPCILTQEGLSTTRGGHKIWVHWRSCNDTITVGLWAFSNNDLQIAQPIRKAEQAALEPLQPEPSGEVACTPCVWPQRLGTGFPGQVAKGEHTVHATSQARPCSGYASSQEPLCALSTSSADPV